MKKIWMASAGLLGVLLILIGVSFYLTNQLNNRQAAGDSVPGQRSSSAASVVAAPPAVSIASWEGLKAPSSIPSSILPVYNTRKRTPQETQALITKYIGPNPTVIEEKEKEIITAYSKDENNPAMITIDNAGGNFSFMSGKGLDVEIDIDTLVEELYPGSQGVEITGTYDRKDTPGVTYILAHRLFSGKTPLNTVGLLNIDEKTPLDTLNYNSKSGKLADENIINTSDKTDGLVPATDFDTMTIAVHQGPDGKSKIMSIDSNIPPIDLGSRRISPLRPFNLVKEEIESSQFDFIITEPGDDNVKWSKAYPENFASFDKVRATDVVLRYIEMPEINELMPFYIIRAQGEANGYNHNLIAAVSATTNKPSNVLGVSTIAQGGQQQQFLDFWRPTPTPTRTPTKTPTLTPLPQLPTQPPVTTCTNNNLIVNGDFEEPVIDRSKNQFQQNWLVYKSSGNTSPNEIAMPNFPGWTLDNQVELQGDYFGKSANGKQYAEIDLKGKVQITQKVNTEAGRKYTLSFYYSPRPGSGSNQELGVFWNNERIATVKENYTGGLQWNLKTYEITAQSGTNILGFGSINNPPGEGNLLDNVSLVAKDCNPLPVANPTTTPEAPSPTPGLSVPKECRASGYFGGSEFITIQDFEPILQSPGGMYFGKLKAKNSKGRSFGKWANHWYIMPPTGIERPRVTTPEIDEEIKKQLDKIREEFYKTTQPNKPVPTGDIFGNPDSFAQYSQILLNLPKDSACPFRVSGNTPTLFIYGNKLSEVKITHPGVKLTFSNKSRSDYYYYEYEKSSVHFDKPKTGWNVKKSNLKSFSTEVAKQLKLTSLETDRLYFELKNAAFEVNSDYLFIGRISEKEINKKLPLSINPTLPITRIHFYVSSGISKTNEVLNNSFKPVKRLQKMALELGSYSK